MSSLAWFVDLCEKKYHREGVYKDLRTKFVIIGKSPSYEMKWLGKMGKFRTKVSLESLKDNNHTKKHKR